MDLRNRLISYAVMYQGEWSRIASAAARELVPADVTVPTPCITVLDEIYPDALRKLRFPPWVLFYEGDITLLQRPMMTIVGSRQMSDYGCRCTVRAAEILRERYVLVSGLAAGVDSCVHMTAMASGHTIGVIGSGLSVRYPSSSIPLYEQMRKTDLILSEYPYRTGVRKHHFPWRNRILAALGEAVIVTQAKVRSGTMRTVEEAVTLGKDIWCFPYPFEDESGAGCNKLIADGAQMLYDTAQLKDMI